MKVKSSPLLSIRVTTTWDSRESSTSQRKTLRQAKSHSRRTKSTPYHFTSKYSKSTPNWISTRIRIHASKAFRAILTRLRVMWKHQTRIKLVIRALDLQARLLWWTHLKMQPKREQWMTSRICCAQCKMSSREVKNSSKRSDLERTFTPLLSRQVHLMSFKARKWMNNSR